MDRETYLFHQTPNELAKELINHVDLCENDFVLEPFKGEGAFYNNLPDYVNKHWCELEEGRDYKDHEGQIDWVITNPPFKLENNEGRVNSFWYLIDYYTDRVSKGIAFLGNDRCFSTLTPIRMKKLNDKGFYVNKIVVCNVKKWRGRYFFIIISKQPSNLFKCIPGSF